MSRVISAAPVLLVCSALLAASAVARDQTRNRDNGNVVAFT